MPQIRPVWLHESLLGSGAVEIASGSKSVPRDARGLQIQFGYDFLVRKITKLVEYLTELLRTTLPTVRSAGLNFDSQEVFTRIGPTPRAVQPDVPDTHVLVGSS